MTADTLKLYHSPASPNSRRVRILLAEKGLKVPLVAVDLGKGEQHSEAYRAINPRRVVPTLLLNDSTAIGEVPAIMRYLDEAFPERPLLGATPKDKGLIAMWERRAELEGFAAVMEACATRLRAEGPRHRRAARLRADSSAGRAQCAAREELLRRPERAAGAGALRRRRALFRCGHHRPRDSGLRQGARAVRAGGSRGAETLVRNRVQPPQRRRLIPGP
jgi:glutathione S-transferase